jgi:DNA-binding beta-propeller fold protein YncE
MSDRRVQLWDLSTPNCPEIPNKHFSRSDLIFGVAFSPDGKMLAAASADGTVVVWEVDNPVHTKEFALGTPMFSVAFSPDGKRLAASAADGTAYLWNVGNWDQRNLSSREGTVGQVSFSPDGAMVVANADRDARAIVAKLDVQGEFVSIGAGRSLFGVAFSPDSNYLLTGSNLDGHVRIWIIGNDQLTKIDRNELLKEGLMRISLHDLNLNERECVLLRTMGIPIFDLAEKDQLDSVDCAFPLLVP